LPGARRTTKVLDGVATTGWFVEDFTLAVTGRRAEGAVFPQSFEPSCLRLNRLVDLRADLSLCRRRAPAPARFRSGTMGARPSGSGEGAWV